MSPMTRPKRVLRFCNSGVESKVRKNLLYSSVRLPSTIDDSRGRKGTSGEGENLLRCIRILSSLIRHSNQTASIEI